MFFSSKKVAAGIILAGCLAASGTLEAQSLASVQSVSGNAVDKTPVPQGQAPSANVNRLGGFFSDLFYDRFTDTYYGVVDRGPGGGLLPYDQRVQKFKLDIDPVTGAATNLRLLDTIHFSIPRGATANGQTGPAAFNGIDPTLDTLNGNAAVLGRSQDAEGFVVAPDGNFFVSDEYGPSIYEFRPDGSFLRAFTPPVNVVPMLGGSVNFSALITPDTGRQANRGYEGVAISPDGSTLYAVLQDPLVEEGSPNGTSSRNLRIVAYDRVSGQSIHQYIYQLESVTSINTRVPASPFKTTNQGSSIGVSSIISINDHEFLVLERDNRGLGVGDPLATAAVSTKRIYRIDINGATDVANQSLKGTNTLPDGVVPVQKTEVPFVDMAALLKAGGNKVFEKIEGIAIGPQLKDGSYVIVAGTDNDFSVTQTGSGEQFDVCTDGTQVTIDTPCPAGATLIPTFYFAFKMNPGQITIASPIDQLINAVNYLDLNPGLSNALTKELNLAGDLASRGRKPLACGVLDLFQLETVLLARQIGVQSASRLLSGADVAKKSFGCR